ncbi:hypothetical protein [Verrucomicrobium spinosum]|uniref:hypothetical protein n=1 Tax=Verrucomicrobium spinosum TaxID=2736 RepID=UPI0009ECAF75|nr:hypothetical protein [Verrucomicrobium spinosum]
MTPLFRKFLGLNWILALNMIALIVWGVWAIYNASSFREGMNLSTVWRSQVQWAVLGLGVFGAAALVDYKWVRWGGWIMYLLASQG